MAEKKEKKKTNQKTKIILGVIAIIVIVAIVGIAGFINYHKKQVELLNQEAEKILNIQIINSDGSINKDAQIDMEIKTKGSYSVVEETLKQYLNEVLTLAKEAENVYSEGEIENALAIENIKEDGPEFTKTKENIANMKQKSEDYINKFLTLCDTNNLLSAIDDKPVSDYYKEIYRRLAVDEETEKSLEDTKKQMEEARITINGAFDYLTSVVQFLSDNKASWMVQGDQIMFKSQSALDEFNKLLDEAPEM